MQVDCHVCLQPRLLQKATADNHQLAKPLQSTLAMHLQASLSVSLCMLLEACLPAFAASARHLYGAKLQL